MTIIFAINITKLASYLQLISITKNLMERRALQFTQNLYIFLGKGDVTFIPPLFIRLFYTYKICLKILHLL